MRPFILILSAPSGGGKTTVARALLAAREDTGYSVSATTRTPRKGEREGRDYHFLSRDEFERRVAAGEFLEWAEYGRNLYGTLREEVDRILRSGRHAVLDVEVQGAHAIRQLRDDVVSIFIVPPSADALMERLGGRSTETPGDLVRRLRTAVRELREAGGYDYVVTNTEKSQAVAEVAAILDAESRRTSRDLELSERLEALGRDIALEADRLEVRADSKES